MNLHFFLHITQEKKDKRGLYPLKAFLDVNLGTYKRMQFTFPKLKLKPDHWCADACRAKPDAPDSAYINLLLDRVQARFDKIKLEAEEQKRFLNPNEVKILLLSKEKPQNQLSDAIDSFLEYYKTMSSLGKVECGTYKNYVGKAQKYWKPYFIDKEGVSELSQIKGAMQHGLYLYVLQHTKGKRSPHNNAFLVITGFRAFMNHCVDHELIAHNPFLRIKYKMELASKIYLTEQELDAIRNAPLPTKKLQDARDFFLIACNTGVSYRELTAIKPSDIYTFERSYLHVKRAKTGTECYVPIFEEAHTLLQKHDYNLDVPSPKVYGKRLRIIKKLAGVKKDITSHTARKTFGNRMLNTEGVSLETVSKLMCHTNTQTTAKYYTEVSREKIQRETSHIK